MSDLIMVQGQACLDYIDKPLGLAQSWGWSNKQLLEGAYKNCEYNIKKDNQYYGLTMVYQTNNHLHRMGHDTNKRIVGYVTNRYEDGGLRVAILGDEAINCGRDGDYYSLSVAQMIQCRSKYDFDITEQINKKSSGYKFYPAYTLDQAEENSSKYSLIVNGDLVDFDDTLDFTPTMRKTVFTRGDTRLKYQGKESGGAQTFILTDDPENTLTYGEDALIFGNIKLDGDHMYNPLQFIAGDLYTYAYIKSMDFWGLCPPSLTDAVFYTYDVEHGQNVDSANGVCIPYNIVLTENLQWAKNYLTNGTLPPDAFLYPLDWDNLPRYDETVPTGDEPDDYPDDNNPDDVTRDFDPTPNEIVSFTVNQLTNYNWYWLTVPQWSDFISWFWNDIGNYSDFDDIIAKVKGLYNDVASAVIMCRYYPVDYEWITQKPLSQAPTGNIKLGMIEKAGAVQLIDQEYSLRSVDIGHVHIGQKYKSFMDMSPYSQLSLYLPWHGFIDLDMNLFNGHDVYVKALYDYLSGTIQYYIFYDNEVLVNTILCKMAMDIPITLQTKNDRDSAIFNNVSSTIGGLVGAGTGILSGNPIGMTLGITQGVGAFNSANASAPMRLMGNVGESGAYIGCQNCFVVVRRPTIQASDGKKKDTEVDTSVDRLTTWKRNVGMLCGYGYKLSSLSGKGFTVCHSPRIDFTNTAPLQSEVEEIYNYLEKGVIL